MQFFIIHKTRTNKIIRKYDNDFLKYLPSFFEQNDLFSDCFKN